MYDRFLFLGLGGSGGSTLGNLKNEIYKWLDENDLGSKIPQGWQFLHIDTPVIPDAEPPLDEDEYLGLIAPSVEYEHISVLLDADNSLHEEMQSWRVDPAGLGVPIGMGAGQFRAVGGTVAAAYASKIEKGVGKQLGRVREGGANTEIGELYHKATGKRPASKNRCHVVVVSSLAGGTGAGILQTVCDIIRATEGEGSRDLFGVLYTPEVFSSLGAAQTGGVQPNSLAAICELSNGYWWNGSADAQEDGQLIVNPKMSAILKKAGLPHALPGSGPAYPFLVGRTGTGGIDHGTPDALFKMVGRSLLSWVTDKQVQRDFLAYNIGNWRMNAMNHETGAGTLVNEGSDLEKGHPSISALGFCRLSVGMDYFRDYAAQRVVRDALEQITQFHDVSPMAQALAVQHDSHDPDEIAEIIAEQHHLYFMKLCGLSELGKDENDILHALGSGENLPEDRLQPPKFTEAVSHFRTQAREIAGIDDGGPQSAEDWRTSIHSGIENALPAFRSAWDEAMTETSEQWIVDVEHSVVVAVETFISAYGLKVARESCLLAAKELRTALREELETVDYGHNNQWSTDWKLYADKELEGAWGSKLSRDDHRLADAFKTGHHMASLVGEALIAKRAAMLAEQAADHLIDPIADALELAFHQANDGLSEANQWPAWSDVEPPESLQPTPGEYALLDSDDFHEHFLALLAESVPSSVSLASQDWIRQTVITGDFLREQHEAGSLEDAKDKLCVSVTEHKPGKAHWYPDTGASFGELRSHQALPVKVNADIRSLERRAKEWLARSGSPFGKFLGQSLRSYLGATSRMQASDVTPAEYARRQAKFAAMLPSAINSAQPLINLDAGIMGLVHPRPIANKINLSQIPLAGHPIHDDTRSTLSALTDLADAKINGLFTNDDSVKHIDITTSLGAAHSVLVIESLMKPIAQAWSQATALGFEGTFWSRRRARTVSEFTPAPQALISCMVRGWLTGVMLGRIDRQPDGDGPVTISQKSPNKTERFPYPFLSQGSGKDDRLPQVLEALGLAYMEVGLKGGLKPLRAYCALRDLGRSEPGADLYTYHDLHPDLRHWIDTGKVVAPNVEPMLTAEEGATKVERAQALIDLLEKSRQKYQNDYRKEKDKWAGSPASLSRAPLWCGISAMLFRELNELQRAATEYEDRIEGGVDLL